MSRDVSIRLATRDEEIADCFPVMHELRPHLVADEFVSRVRTQQASGYRLAYCIDEAVPVCVAGFRIGESLSWGRFLYVDDLVTHESARSRGYGSAMLRWLHEYAEKQGCNQLHLDSGLQREDAHRFYHREGMITAAYHFVTPLD